MLKTDFSIVRCMLAALGIFVGLTSFGQPVTLVTRTVIPPQELLDTRVGWDIPLLEPLTIGSRSKAHLQFDGVLQEYEVFDLDAEVVAEVRAEAPYTFEMSLPRTAGSDWVLELVAADIFTHDYVVKTSSGALSDSHPIGYHYWGVVKGVPGSWVALSVFEDEIMGVLHHPSEGTMTLGKASGLSGQYLLYRSRDELDPQSLSSATALLPLEGAVLESGLAGSLDEAIDGIIDNVVRVHLECDYDLYQSEGSVKACLKKNEGIMNMVALVYSQMEVRVLLSESKVRTQPVGGAKLDPQAALEKFAKQTPNFKGDVACLLSGGSSSAGAAFVSGFGKAHEAGGPYSYVPASAHGAGYPNYSFLTQMVASELGYSLGARVPLWSASSSTSGAKVNEIGGLDLGKGIALQAISEIRYFAFPSSMDKNEKAGATNSRRWRPASNSQIYGIKGVVHGKWVCVNGTRTPEELWCNRSQMRAWEEFRFECDASNPCYWVAVHVNKLIERNGRKKVVTTNAGYNSGTRINWYPAYTSNGLNHTLQYYSIRVSDYGPNDYVSHGRGRSPMSCKRDNASYWEVFQFFKKNSKTQHVAPTIEEPTVTLYPNPAADFIELEGVTAEDELEVYNIQGQRLMQARGVSILDLSTLASGMYFLKVNQEQTIRFTKR